MKAIIKWATAYSMLALMAAGSAVAQEEGEGPTAFPVEIYVCNFNDGMEHTDLNKWAVRWNAWIDSASSPPEPYSAWTLTPFYFGEDQDFDFIWLVLLPMPRHSAVPTTITWPTQVIYSLNSTRSQLVVRTAILRH